VVQQLGVRQHQATAGQEEHVGSVLIQTVHPPSNWRARTQNDASLVLRLQYGRFTALLTGDLDGPGEAQVVSRAADLRSLLLKTPHHGSRNAAREALLRRVQARWAVVSVGRNNPFGNPAVETLQRLLRSGARPLLTSDQGAITFETDGVNYLLSSHRCGVLDEGELPPHF
jgi:competence protein ComEC